MLLFAAFKGLSWGEQLNSAVDDMLRRVELYDRRNSYSKNFSGGMKRRLSVALSSVGDVDVLVLVSRSAQISYMHAIMYVTVMRVISG